MPDMGLLGITAVLTGIAIVVIILVSLRAFPRNKTGHHAPLAQDSQETNRPPEAVLLVESGGRVAFINAEGREWFGLLEEDPNLERLARRTRPSEVFLDLCAHPGQARFSIHGRFVEGTSYSIPHESGKAILVAIQKPQVAPAADSGQVSSQAFDIFAELSQAMAASLDLDATLQAVLENVDKIIPSDFPEITVWEPDNQQLVPYRFVGMPGLDRHIEKASERYDLQEGYSGYLINERKPLFIGNVDAFREVRPVIDRKQYPFNSFMGVPLLVGDEPVGTLELASLSKDAFSHNDLEALRLLSRQAAIAVHNAVLYKEEQRRIVELSGLSQLVRAAGSLQDPQDLTARLIESIKSLLEVNLIGFWVYDESQHNLVAQQPFFGLPPQFTTIYHISITPGSPAEEILLSKQMIVAPNAPEDKRLAALDLDHRAQAAGIRSTVLAPLISGPRSLGYLQVGDKLNGEAFNSEDLRILTIIAGQVSIIIENAALVQQTQRRAMRAEALRRIASLMASTATMDEVLQYSLRELARLLQADFAAVYMLDENLGRLRLHTGSLYGVPSDLLARLKKPTVDAALSMFASTDGGQQRSYFTHDAFEETEGLLAYSFFIDNLQIRSVINVPLLVDERSSGEMMLGSRTPGFFDRSDVTLIATAAGQLAAAFEQSTRYQQTDDTLRQRAELYATIARMNQELHATEDLPELLKRVYTGAMTVTGASCGSIFLLDTQPLSTHTQLLVWAGDPHGDGLSEVELQVLEQEAPLIVQDFDLLELKDESGHSQPPHEGVRSALLVPIAHQGQVQGLIHLHGKNPGQFDQASLEICQTLVLQASLAIGSAMRYQEQLQHGQRLAIRSDSLARWLGSAPSIRGQQPVEQSLQAVASGIQEAGHFTSVMISLYDSNSDCLQPFSFAGLPLDLFDNARQQPQPLSALQPYLQPEYAANGAYIIPGSQASTSGDLLLVPLSGAEKSTIGLISAVLAPGKQAPDLFTLETVDIFASQAALLIDGSQQLHNYQILSENLGRELERAEQARQASQSQLPNLLRKDFEQTLAIQGLSQRVKRIRAGLDIAEIVNRQADRSDVLQSLAHELLTRMELDIALVAESSAGGPRLLHSLGSLPPGANPSALLGQRNPIRQCLQNGENILVNHVEESGEWQNTPLLQALHAGSFICLAVPVEDMGHQAVDGAAGSTPGAQTGQTALEAVVMGISLKPVPPFTAEDEQLFALLARQAAIALQNLRLFSETNRRLREVNLLLDFSRKLGSFDPSQILHTLVESAMQVLPAAQAGLVAIWDHELGALAPKAAQGYLNPDRILQITYRPGEALPGQVYASGKALRLDEVDFARHYNLPSENLMRYRDGTGGKLPVSTLIVPIASATRKASDTGELGSGIRPLGILVLDSFQTAAAFTEEDQALVTSLVQQTALSLENARLYQASEQRAVQLQTLTDVAATITSSLQTDELIDSLLDQVKPILPYNTGTLWLRSKDHLTIRSARGFADTEERIGLSVFTEDSLLLKEMIDQGRPIYVEDVREDPRFPSLIEHQYFSWLGIPLISKGEVAGVIALEKEEARYYTPEHIQVATTFAGQAAVALENANLYEESVRRAIEMDQRSQRLALLNRLSTELSSLLDAPHILKLTIQEMLLAINCAAISAILFDAGGQPVVEAESPRTSPNLPLPLPDAPVFSRLRESQGVFNIEDIYGADGQIDPLLGPISAYLDSRQSRSLLVLPLMSGTHMHGAIFAQKEQAYRFTAEEVELARTISNQASVSVQNARLLAETRHLYAETRQRSSELATLFDLGMDITQILDQEQLIEIIFENLVRVLEVQSASLMLQEEDGGLTVYLLQGGEKTGPLPVENTGLTLSELVLESGQPQRYADLSTPEPGLPEQVGPLVEGVRSWLGAPMVVRGRTTGVLSVQSDQPGFFQEEHTRLVGQIANQLGVALDNARLFSTVQSYAADLEQRVAERTAQLAQEHERTETLLGIITELSTSLDMDIVLERTLALINDTVKGEHSLIMLISPEDNNLYLRASVGYLEPTPKGGRPSALKRNAGLAGWVISNRKPVLSADLRQDPRWEKHDDQTTLHRSAIAVPLLMGEEILGTLMIFHRKPGQFAPDLLTLVQATAKQIAVAINNAQLFNLIRDQAERLGDMLRQQHIETSRSQAILEAVADGVLVTDANRGITLFNASAEQILGLHRKQVLGQSLEHFTGLFGKAAQTWVDTIRTWSEDPSTYKPGDIYAEQIELDDKRVVSVHLSPVRLRNDFLGTVSTFRDITHQVEVDRLKSEFVATVSHELRTPMTSIKGYVEVLLMGAAGKLNEQQSHFLDIVKANTERLAVLVNDLLDISRIEAGRVTLSLQPLDLAKVAQVALEDLQRRTAEDGKPMDISAVIPSDVPLVVGDAERVRQIIDNLLENAYYYTPENGRICLALEQVDDQMHVHVRDNGIGILPKEQARVFERFYRGEDPLVLATSGTGLGLSIVQRLIEMHQGRIWLQSSGVPGQGSVFSISLPLYEPGE